MLSFLSPFMASFIIAAIIVFTTSFHGHFTNDMDLNSVQKFHSIPVPRIGGLALLLGLYISSMFGFVGVYELSLIKFKFILLASLPVFFIGLLEDITKQASIKLRLYISFLSAALVYYFANIHFIGFGLEWFDAMVISIPIVSFALTLLVVAGTVHAINLIDGFNGLMLGTSFLMFCAIALVAHWVGDIAIVHFSLICAGAVAGLFLLNFPFGLIFSGDGGAYLIGFLLASDSLLLTQRNSEVSPWFSCLLLIYPIFETLFSIYRKRYLRGMSPTKPDGLHLHMLVHKRILRRHYDKICMKNSSTSCYLIALALLGIIPAVVFWNNTLLSILFCIIFCVIYLSLYSAIVKFKMHRITFKNYRVCDERK